MHLSPLGALAAVRTKAVVLLLLIYCLLLLPLYVVFLCLFLICFVVLSVLDQTAAEATGWEGKEGAGALINFTGQISALDSTEQYQNTIF